MLDWTVSELAEQYKAGRVTRRQFIRRMLSVGLTAPVIASVLAACGSSSNNKQANASAAAKTAAGAASATASASTFKPTKRGGGGTLKLLWWQAPTILNSHLANGSKDYDASRIFYEPLAEFDTSANLIPALAAEIPSLDNGGVAKDGTSVTWKLKQGVQWHDGQPFSSDDVVFTYQYLSDPATAATSIGAYTTVASVTAVDANTIKVTFKQPTPYWQTAFVGIFGYILPKHVFEQFKGAQARSAPANLKPVGTGPYKLASFTPGDNLQADLWENYHEPNRPFFDHVAMKGGGDAVSAARAVLQTGDYDYAWNMQVEYDQLTGFAQGGPGTILISPGSSTEHINFNFADPNNQVDGEYSSIKSKHPFFSDPKVRQAFALMLDRKTIVDQLYGKEGDVGAYVVFNPSKYTPGPSTWALNAQQGAQILDAAGWKKGSDGTRANNGVKMHVLFQTSVNTLRQNEQAIVKKNLEDNGIAVDLKSVDAGVYFGDSTNPDSFPYFKADLEMFTNGPDSVDPQSYFRNYVAAKGSDPTGNIAQKANSWSGSNSHRYVNPAFDQLWNQAGAELDPVKRADLFKQMNQTIINDNVTIPLVARNGVTALKKDLQDVQLTTWASDLWRLAYWHR
jgi:peptide/nickel transport system substrate-binding protein